MTASDKPNVTQLRRLRSAYADAAVAYDAVIVETVEEEQRALDELVDYVEAHDLNGSEWDPRGPE
jgi:hypothetical protein